MVHGGIGVGVSRTEKSLRRKGWCHTGHSNTDGMFLFLFPTVCHLRGIGVFRFNHPSLVFLNCFFKRL